MRQDGENVKLTRQEAYLYLRQLQELEATRLREAAEIRVDIVGFKSQLYLKGWLDSNYDPLPFDEKKV